MWTCSSPKFFTEEAHFTLHYWCACHWSIHKSAISRWEYIFCCLFQTSSNWASKSKNSEVVIKIQFHFPFRLFFKAEKVLIIDIYQNISLSTVLTIVPFAFPSAISSPSPQTHLPNALLPLPKYFPLAFTCSPLSNRYFLLLPPFLFPFPIALCHGLSEVTVSQRMLHLIVFRREDWTLSHSLGSVCEWQPRTR